MTKTNRTVVALEGVVTVDGAVLIEPGALKFHEEDIPVVQGEAQIALARDFQRDKDGAISAEIDGTIPKGLKLGVRIFETNSTPPDENGRKVVQDATVVAVDAGDSTAWAELNG